MRLSVNKRFGWTQVRGGRVLRVAKPHAVKTSGRSELADVAEDLDTDEQLPRWEGERPQWVYAKEGDLAVEIIAVKTGAILGHTYLSGPAIQLNGYTPFDVGWFGDAVGVELVELPRPHGTFDAAFIEEVLGVLMPLKYSESVAVGVFHYRCDKNENPCAVARGLATMWSYEDETRKSTTHLLGVVEGPGLRKKNRDHVTLHFQPSEHANDFAATGFQIELVLRAALHLR